MPFYEYECSNCKFYTEVMQKISDAPLEKCPSCGKKTMVKLISAPVFRLKGSGWYETDFKDDKEGKRNLAGGDEEPASKSEEASDSSGKDSAKSEDKAGSAKADSSKSETIKTEKPKAEPKARPKPVTAERKNAARTTKPPARASASKSKSRPAPSRAASKGKSAKAKPARKKARR